MATEQTALLPRNEHLTSSQANIAPRYKPWKRLLAVGVLTLAAASMLVLHSMEPWIPEVVDHDFGVGFDLAYPYAYVANGFCLMNK